MASEALQQATRLHYALEWRTLGQYRLRQPVMGLVIARVCLDQRTIFRFG